MSQNAAILTHLKKRKKITPLEALDKFDCLRLSGRIYDLRHDGHPIITDWKVKNGKRFAEYRLA